MHLEYLVIAIGINFNQHKNVDKNSSSKYLRRNHIDLEWNMDE